MDSSSSDRSTELVQLMMKYQRRIFAYIHTLVPSRSDAEDILQDVFIKTINIIDNNKYNEQGKFLPWILRVAHNLAIDHFRKEKRNPKITLPDGSDIFNSLRFSEDVSDSEVLSKSTKDHLKKIIKSLPDKQREVLIMRHYMEMSFQEIAEATGVSINTALGRMRYALIALRKKIKQKH